MVKKLKELEQKIGYTFRDFSLLERAMMHSSYTNEKHLPKYQCNERLEFLGDAVLELVSSEFLFRESPKMPEGTLTKTRASMVCEPSLALCARDIDLGSYLLLGKGEEATGGRNRDSVTSDALEALMAPCIWMVVLLMQKSSFINSYLQIWKIRNSFMIVKLSFRRWYRRTRLEPLPIIL